MRRFGCPHGAHSPLQQRHSLPVAPIFFRSEYKRRSIVGRLHLFFFLFSGSPPSWPAFLYEARPPRERGRAVESLVLERRSTAFLVVGFLLPAVPGGRLSAPSGGTGSLPRFPFGRGRWGVYYSQPLLGKRIVRGGGAEFKKKEIMP